MNDLQHKFESQCLANGYVLINGVEMHALNGDQFQIPHPVLKRHLGSGHFVELRIDSPRFAIHEDAPGCTCPSCNGKTDKPILRHEHPASLIDIPHQNVPARGWGEDFWVQVESREGEYFVGTVDNVLVETRLHELSKGDEIAFHEDHVLAVHSIHRQELVLDMNDDELQELAEWIRLQGE